MTRHSTLSIMSTLACQEHQGKVMGRNSRLIPEKEKSNDYLLVFHPQDSRLYVFASPNVQLIAFPADTVRFLSS